jgi:hypothetical protein
MVAVAVALRQGAGSKTGKRDEKQRQREEDWISCLSIHVSPPLIRQFTGGNENITL